MSSTPDKRSTEGWAKPVRSLEVSGVEPGSPAINVAGKRPTSPIQGFGRMWQKTYRVLLVGADVDAARGDRRLEGSVRQLLAEGQPLLRAALRHRAGRGRRAQPVHARQD